MKRFTLLVQYTNICKCSGNHPAGSLSLQACTVSGTRTLLSSARTLDSIRLFNAVLALTNNGPDLFAQGPRHGTRNPWIGIPNDSSRSYACSGSLISLPFSLCPLFYPRPPSPTPSECMIDWLCLPPFTPCIWCATMSFLTRLVYELVSKGTIHFNFFNRGQLSSLGTRIFPGSIQWKHTNHLAALATVVPHLLWFFKR